MIEVRVSDRPIRPEAFHANPGHGAQVVFTGVVRDHNQGKRVLGVSYDAFIPLAEKTFAELCAEAREKFGSALDFRVLHRVGRLGVGEVSVVVAVSSPHRSEAYEASRHVIEGIKHRAPIWKKEHYEDGETAWLQGHALCS